jgi:hypothetical protein
MRDPHVVSLTYQLKTSESVTFDAPPLEHETEVFSLRLEDDVLTVEMKEHFASVDTARKVTENFLVSWEAHVSLTKGRGEISFKYGDAEVIDRDPSKLGDTVWLKHADLKSEARISGEISVHATRSEYPTPPEDFATSPEVEALLERYHRCLDGKEKLLPMANFCYTVFKGIAGGKSKASKLFNISGGVLMKLGELTARGDLRTARKWRDEKQNRPLSQSEENWLKQVVKRMILRLGEYNANPKGPFGKITMADFPQL